jgi:hypothetical protein
MPGSLLYLSEAPTLLVPAGLAPTVLGVGHTKESGELQKDTPRPRLGLGLQVDGLVYEPYVMGCAKLFTHEEERSTCEPRLQLRA